MTDTLMTPKAIIGSGNTLDEAVAHAEEQAVHILRSLGPNAPTQPHTVQSLIERGHTVYMRYYHIITYIVPAEDTP